MKGLRILLAPVLALCIALPAAAQTIPAGPKESARDRAVKRCKENRGTDCESREGLREWLREERELTEAERQAAIAGRRHREMCAKDRKAAGC
jgi:hypothetical protein